VRKYKDRKDIIFISLAEDTRTIKVVLLKPLSYSVPNMKDYMNLTLQLNAYTFYYQ
jgi:hypothetical protein